MEGYGVTGWGLLLILWIGGLALYFWKTTESQRQGHIVIVWGLMLLPILYGLVKLALSL